MLAGSPKVRLDVLLSIAVRQPVGQIHVRATFRVVVGIELNHLVIGQASQRNSKPAKPVGDLLGVLFWRKAWIAVESPQQQRPVVSAGYVFKGVLFPHCVDISREGIDDHEPQSLTPVRCVGRIHGILK